MRLEIRSRVDAERFECLREKNSTRWILTYTMPTFDPDQGKEHLIRFVTNQYTDIDQIKTEIRNRRRDEF